MCVIMQEVEKALVGEAENLSELLRNLEAIDQTASRLHFTASKNLIYSACSL